MQKKLLFIGTKSTLEQEKNFSQGRRQSGWQSPHRAIWWLCVVSTAPGTSFVGAELTGPLFLDELSSSLTLPLPQLLLSCTGCQMPAHWDLPPQAYRGLQNLPQGLLPWLTSPPAPPHCCLCLPQGLCSFSLIWRMPSPAKLGPSQDSHFSSGAFSERPSLNTF